jgi:hypothetical protein
VLTFFEDRVTAKDSRIVYQSEIFNVSEDMHKRRWRRALSLSLSLSSRANAHGLWRTSNRRPPRSNHVYQHYNTLATRTMRWPWSSDADDRTKPSHAGASELSDWATSLLEPRTLVPSIALTVSTVAAVRLYKSYLRRIPSVNHIKPSYFRRRTLFGQVTSVGDADNFRLYHTPGGRLAGWGWLPWKKVPTKRDQLTNQTVRLLHASSCCVAADGA